MKKLSFIILSVFLFSTLIVKGQTFEDFEKQIDEEYAEFEKKTDRIFNEYVQEIDKEFAGYLAENFKEYALKKSEKKETGPKPDKIPRYTEIPQWKPEEINISGNESDITPNEIILPVVKRSEPDHFETRHFAFDFFGSEIAVDCDKNMLASPRKIHTAEDVAAYWEEMSKVYYNHLLNQFNIYYQNLNLNDWAYYQLIRQFSAKAYPSDENMQNLLTWYLLTRAGYKNRIAFDNSHTYVLVSSVYPLAGSFVRLNNINYYLPGKDIGQAKT